MEQHAPAPLPVRVRALRERAGLSLDEMARAAGFKGASSWQRYEDEATYRKDYLAPHIVTQLAESLVGRGNPPITTEDVLALGGSAVLSRIGRPAGVPQPPIEAVPTGGDPGHGGPDVIPVYGAARGGDDQEMFLDDGPIDYVPRPTVLKNVRQAYAMQVTGDSMRPMYRAGQLVHVNPFKVARREMGVVVYKTNGAVLVKEFVGRTPKALRLKEYQPKEREFEIAQDQIKEVHVIMGTAEQ